MRGVQAAVALRRQRSRRDDKTRRLTNSSLESITPQASTDGCFSSDRERETAKKSRRCMFGITLFHIGLVLLFIGFLLVITAMVPGYVKKAEKYDLVGTGTFFVVIGGVLTLVNRVLQKREDDNLEKYVSGKLARSKSGGRLVKDAESGLTPDVHRRSHRRHSRSPRSPRSPHSPEGSTANSLDADIGLSTVPEESAGGSSATSGTRFTGGTFSPAEWSATSIGKDSSGDSQAALLSPTAEAHDVRVVLDPPRSGKRLGGVATSV